MTRVEHIQLLIDSSRNRISFDHFGVDAVVTYMGAYSAYEDPIITYTFWISTGEYIQLKLSKEEARQLV